MVSMALAEERDKIYDDLSLDEGDVFDRIAAAGFRPETDGSRWVAVRGDERVGPFPGLAELGDAVGQETGDWRLEPREVLPANDANKTNEDGGIADFDASDEVEDQATDDDSVEVEIDEDHKGNTYLPHVKPVVDQQLAEAAGKFFADNNDWKEARKRRKDSQSTLATAAEMKRHLFHQDPDNTHSLIYHAGGLKIRIAKESKTTVTVEEEKDDA